MSPRRCHQRRRERRPLYSGCLALLLALWVGGPLGARLSRVTPGTLPARDVSHVAALTFPVLAPAHPTVRPAAPILIRVDHAAIPHAGAPIPGPITADRSASRTTRPQNRIGNVHPPASRAPPSPVA